MRTPRRSSRIRSLKTAWLVVVLPVLLAAPAAFAQQPDSVAAPSILADTSAAAPVAAATPVLQTQQPFPGHHPNGALWRAAAVPGWGQFYNRQYYKIPVVYLGLGGVVAAIVYTNDRYLLYRNAFRFAQVEAFLADGELTEAERAKCASFDCDPERYRDEGERFRSIIDANRADALRREREKFRRNRDLSIVGLGVVYGLTMVDAYVSAHLLGFDVGEDLSARLRPGPEGPEVALRYVF